MKDQRAGSAQLVCVYTERFSIWWPKFLLHLDCGYLTWIVTMPPWKLWAYFRLWNVVPLDWKRLTGRIEQSFDRWIEAIRRSDGGSTTADASVRAAAVKLGPQKNWRAIVRVAVTAPDSQVSTIQRVTPHTCPICPSTDDWESEIYTRVDR